MTHEELRELCALYALGTLDPASARELEAHLETGCPDCQRELDEYRRVSGLLAYVVPPTSPEPGAKERLLSRAVARERPPEADTGPAKPGVWLRQRPLAWAAGVALVLFAGFLGWQLVEYRTELAERRAELERLTAILGVQQELIESLRSPGVRVVNLGGLERRPQAVGRIFWHIEPNTWEFRAYNLPPAPPGKIYQLWFITKKAKISAGIFQTDQRGEGLLRVKVPKELKEITAAAVTLEPEDGVPQPTGEIYLFGEL
ncbi:MAG: anti-sigma factor domain-containing protein [Candidatus Methylomirabilales bacterium]